MIRSFKNKDTEGLYRGKCCKRWQFIAKQAERRLQILDSAAKLEDLRNLPSNRFKALSGNREGQYSISINLQGRECFKWIDDEPYEVEIVYYH